MQPKDLLAGLGSVLALLDRIVLDSADCTARLLALRTFVLVVGLQAVVVQSLVVCMSLNHTAAVVVQA